MITNFFSPCIFYHNRTYYTSSTLFPETFYFKDFFSQDFFMPKFMTSFPKTFFQRTLLVVTVQCTVYLIIYNVYLTPFTTECSQQQSTNMTVARWLESSLRSLNLFVRFSRHRTLTCLILETITTKFTES